MLPDDEPPRRPAAPRTRHYTLACPGCGRRQEDDGLALRCAADHEPALLQTDYAEQAFDPDRAEPGLFRYRKWLPVVQTEPGAGRTAVYRSHGLGRFLGLPSLWIAFNGYWPERGAFLETATFKELEAHAVLGRMAGPSPVLTVASSGNTGAAFAWACSQQGLPCVLVVPQKSLWRFSFPGELDPCVRLVSIAGGEYPDAIALAAEVARMRPFQPEGGVMNVARRDGLATVLLAAFEEMRELPSHYFQAVGSGTGAIAVHEAAKRLRSAAPELSLPRLVLCQNKPFTPIFDAWQTKKRSPPSRAGERFRSAISEVYADELTNWAPPYSVIGGVYDCLRESGGDVMVADNQSVHAAMSLFREVEGIDIEPAAAVALACLCRAAREHKIGPSDVVLLNITGGGRRRAEREQHRIAAVPTLRITRESESRAASADQVAALCASETGASEPCASKTMA